MHELLALLLPQRGSQAARSHACSLCTLCAQTPSATTFFSDRQVTSRQAARRHAGSLCTLCAQTPSATTFFRTGKRLIHVFTVYGCTEDQPGAMQAVCAHTGVAILTQAFQYGHTHCNTDTDMFIRTQTWQCVHRRYYSAAGVSIQSQTVRFRYSHKRGNTATGIALQTHAFQCRH